MEKGGPTSFTDGEGNLGMLIIRPCDAPRTLWCNLCHRRFAEVMGFEDRIWVREEALEWEVCQDHKCRRREKWKRKKNFLFYKPTND